MYFSWCNLRCAEKQSPALDSNSQPWTREAGVLARRLRCRGVGFTYCKALNTLATVTLRIEFITMVV